MAHYRQGQSLTHSLSNEIVDYDNCYGSPTSRQGYGSSPSVPHYAPRPVYNQHPGLPDKDLDAKLDQMMVMVSNTQIMLVEQMSTSTTLQKSVDKLSEKIVLLKNELDDVKKSTITDSSSQLCQKHIKLPTHLSVSYSFT